MSVVSVLFVCLFLSRVEVRLKSRCTELNSTTQLLRCWDYNTTFSNNWIFANRLNIYICAQAHRLAKTRHTTFCSSVFLAHSLFPSLSLVRSLAIRRHCINSPAFFSLHSVLLFYNFFRISDEDDDVRTDYATHILTQWTDERTALLSLDSNRMT